MIIATRTQGTEFSLCQDDSAATLAALDIPSNRGGCLYLESSSGSLGWAQRKEPRPAIVLRRLKLRWAYGNPSSISLACLPWQSEVAAVQRRRRLGS